MRVPKKQRAQEHSRRHHPPATPLEEEESGPVQRQVIIGVDEVGVGPIAGPIVVAAVALRPPTPFLLQFSKEWWPLADVRDSKKISKKKLPLVFDSLMAFLIDQCGEVGWGIASVAEIDALGHADAYYRALTAAARNVSDALEEEHKLLVVDGVNLIPGVTRQVAVPKADQSVFVVAAASIIAKVTRDRIMTELGETYPEYGFRTNAGYGTKTHIEALLAHGPSPHHRAKATATTIRNAKAKL